MRACGLRSARISVFPPGAAQASRMFSDLDLAAEIFGWRCGQLSNQLRSFILNAHAAFAKGRGRSHVAGDDGARGGEDAPGSRPTPACDEFGFDGGGFVSAWRRTVRAAGPGRGGRSLAQLPGRRTAPSARPSTRDAPEPMRVRPRSLPEGLPRGPAAASLRSTAFTMPGGKAMAGLLGQLHALIDGGVRGNAIEKLKLKCAQAQSDRDFGIEFGFRLRDQELESARRGESASEARRAPEPWPDCDRRGRARRLLSRAADRLRGALAAARRPAEFEMRLCGLERWRPQRSTEARVRGQRIAAQKLGGGHALLAFELNFKKFEPGILGAGGQKAMALDDNPARLGKAQAPPRSCRAQRPCDARSAFSR